MTALQSAVLEDFTAIDDVAPWSPADQALFAELRTVLERHGAVSRFGVTLLHKHFDVTADEVLVEVCDIESRTLTTRPRAKSEISGKNVIETNWRLDSLDGTRESITVCVTQNGTHVTSRQSENGE